MSLPLRSVALFLLLQEEGHAPEKFLGIPLPLWQLVNLLLFLGVLAFFVARPLAAAFRSRQVEIEKRTREAEHRRAEVDRLSREIEDRTVRLEREIEEVRRQGVAEGQSARSELLARAQLEAERIRLESAEEIERRLAAARQELRNAAADLTASSAVDLVARAVTEDDRRRLLQESAVRVKGSA